VAGLLAREGRDVLVVDRATFPRPKPCGECLNPGAVAALRRLGLLEPVLALEPARLEGWSVGGGGRAVRGDFGGSLHGLGVPRERLDAALLEEARHRGARLLEGVKVEEVAPSRSGAGPEVRVRLPAGGSATVRPRVVVGADGLRSRVARSLGLVGARPRPTKASLTVRVRWTEGEAPEQGRLRVHDGITLGVAPVDARGRLGNVTVVADTRRHRGALAGGGDALVRHVLAERLGPPLPEVVGGPWSSGPFRQPVPRPWAPGVVLVGDAAGYYDPFTGQGIYRALRSAELATPAILATLAGGTAGGPWTELARYGTSWTAEVRPRRRLQMVVETVMARNWLREPTLAVLEQAALLPALIRVTGDAAPLSSLLRPWGWTRNLE
jgi:flavin-dependent dehydrogenase